MASKFLGEIKIRRIGGNNNAHTIVRPCDCCKEMANVQCLFIFYGPREKQKTGNSNKRIAKEINLCQKHRTILLQYLQYFDDFDKEI